MTATAYRYVSPHALLVEYFGLAEGELSGMTQEEEFVLAVLIARQADEKVIVHAPRSVMKAAEPLMDEERPRSLHHW